MLGILGKVITLAAKPLLPLLGTLGKGKATALGAVGATVGAVLAGAPQLVGGVITDANVVQVLHEIGLVLIALFGMLGSFGIGRKAGAGS